MFMLMLHKKMMAFNKCLCKCYTCEDYGNEEMITMKKCLWYVTQEDNDNKEMFM
jgi:hypothetical protein